MKALSCGVIITDGNVLLAETPFGMIGKLDVPKGHLEKFETPVDCAVRELYEETGVRIFKNQLQDLGIFKYTAFKDLHLYLYKVTSEKLPLISTMKCNSFFKDTKGKLRPEILSYRYVPFDDPHFYKSLRPVLQTVSEIIK